MLKTPFAYLFAIVGGLVFAGGCDSSNVQRRAEDSQPAGPLPTFEVVVLDDEDLASAIEREWPAASGNQVRVKRIPATDVKLRQSWSADVIVFPPRLMGELVSRRILRPLERESKSESNGTGGGSDLDTMDFFSLTRTVEMYWGKRLYAASLGSPQLVLLYRSDVIEQLGLELPQTWTEYSAFVQAINSQADLARSILQNEDTASPFVAEPYADDWAAKMFLARAAAYARNRDQYSCLFTIHSFQPQIDRPPFIRTLDEIRSLPKQVVSNSSPSEIAARFVTGELAMAITWPESLRSMTDLNPANNIQIGITSLPGSNEFYDRNSERWQSREVSNGLSVPLLGVAGYCAGIGRRAADIDRAYDFIIWLTDPQNSVRISRQSPNTTIARLSQASDMATMIPPPFADSALSLAETLQRDQSRELSLTVPRVPGQDRYMNALASAIRESLDSEEPSEQILRRVSNEWKSITEELGVDEQIKAYAESLGINP